MRLCTLVELGSLLCLSLCLSACGNENLPANAGGSWFWKEQINIGSPPPPDFVTHASLIQMSGDITGTVDGSMATSAGVTCTLTATLTGNKLQGEIASPCNETFTLTISSDNNSMEGTITGTNGAVNLTLTRDRT